MIPKQFCKAHNSLFFFIIYCLFIGIVNGKEFLSYTIKPEQPDSIKFSRQGDTRIYHRLDSSLTYYDITKNTKSNFDDDQILRIKIRARALNHKSSSKWSNFGIKVIRKSSSLPNDTTNLKFRKRIDRKIKCEECSKDEELLSISKAGRWFFDIPLDSNFVFKRNNGDPRDTIDYLISLLPENNEQICVRVNVQQIKHQRDDSGVIPTIDHAIIHYVDAENNAEYTGKYFEYYGLNMTVDEREEHQFKIRGPMKVRVYNRPKDPKDSPKVYSIKLKENGLLLGEYTIDAWNQYYEDKKFKTPYFHFTVPKGEHFYTISSDEQIFIRLKKYRVAQNK